MPGEDKYKWPTNRPIDEALYHACSTGSCEEVRALLARGGESECTALGNAVV